MHGAAPAGPCRNCGHALGAVPAARFCPACGQTTALHPPTVFEFAHEFVAHYVALEGALWRTLAALLLKPGQLSLEYFAGRRTRYIAPLRLYLSFSLLFFAVAFSTGAVHIGSENLRLGDKAEAEAADIEIDIAPSGTLPALPALERIERRIEAVPPAQRAERINRGITKYLPYLLILLVPVLALYKQLLYWQRRRRYAEHLVVAFHAQTVVFVFAIVSALPLPEWLGMGLIVLLFAHGAIGLRRVYGGGIVATLLREAVLLGAYGLTVGVATVLLVISTLAT